MLADAGCECWKYAIVRKMLSFPLPKILILRSKFEKPLKLFSEAINICPHDQEIIQYVDTAEEVLQLIEEDFKQRTTSATIILHPSFSS